MAESNGINNTIYDAVSNALENKINNCNTLLPSTTGKSTYDLAVDYGYVGTERDWLSSIANDTTVVSNLYADAQSFADFMSKPSAVSVPRRLAPSIHTLNYYLDYFNGLESLYSQESGMVTVNGVEIKTVRQAMSDAIDDVLLGEYQEGMRADLNAQKLDTGITATAKNGGVDRTQADKNSDYISVNDFSSITDIEIALTNKRIDMLGQTITVTVLPTKNQYYNGWFSLNGVSYRAERSQDVQITNDNVIVGANTPDLPINSVSAITAIGNGALESTVSNRHCIAIGTRALKNMTAGRYNIAIGLESQYWANSGDAGVREATRNVSVGDNSSRFNVTGASNIAIGRNTGQCIVNKSLHTAVGAAAMAGFGSLKFKNYSFISNETPILSEGCVAVGASALFFGGGDKTIAIGTNSMGNAKINASQCVAVGDGALGSLGITAGHHGGSVINKNTPCTYVMTATEVVITLAGHDIAINDYVQVVYTSGIQSNSDPHFNKVIAKTANTFTIAEPEGVPTSGNLTLVYRENMAVPAPTTQRNIAIGSGAMFGTTSGQYNVGIGSNTLPQLVDGEYNTAIGDTALGVLAGNSSSNAALGFQALRYNIDGTGYTNGNNRVGIGARSRTSADNQIQLGFTTHSTYAYGAVQDRSDARDKIIEGDITDAHINFFNDVEFKRYRLDYRDDYIEIDGDGNVTKLDKDGSKARKREHVGVIAQQVEEAMRAHNVDFAGLQHHAVSGGNDVYTVGYQEFIPILGEIVQRQQKQIDELKALIEK